VRLPPPSHIEDNASGVTSIHISIHVQLYNPLRYGANFRTSTLLALPSNRISLITFPVPGALQMPQHECPLATKTPFCPGTAPIKGVPRAERGRKHACSALTTAWAFLSRCEVRVDACAWRVVIAVGEGTTSAVVSGKGSLSDCPQLDKHGYQRGAFQRARHNQQGTHIYAVPSGRQYTSGSARDPSRSVISVNNACALNASCE
jgi:hypothetical protein